MANGEWRVPIGEYSISRQSQLANLNSGIRLFDEFGYSLIRLFDYSGGPR
jgi:hypothetical protein